MAEKTQNGRVNVNITLPEYVNLYLYNDYYVVTVTFPITKEMYDYMKVLYKDIKYFECIKVNGKHYCRFFKKYTYNVPFSISLFNDANKDKNTLKIMMRDAKMSLLQLEILAILKENI